MYKHEGKQTKQMTWQKGNTDTRPAVGELTDY